MKMPQRPPAAEPSPSRRQVIAALAAVSTGFAASTATARKDEQEPQLWTASPGSFDGSTPTVVDGTLFVGSLDGSVYAYDAENGEKRWQYETDDAIEASPTVKDGVVYIGSTDGRVYALDAEDGSQNWAYDVGTGMESTPAVFDERVYFGTSRERVYALDPADGSELWTKELLSDEGRGVNAVRWPPVVTPDGLFVATNNSTFALTHDGEKLWDTWRPGMGGSAPVVRDGTFYITRRVHASGFHGLDTATGELEWEYRLPGSNRVGSPTVTERQLTAPVGPAVHALSTEEEAVHWEFRRDESFVDSTAVADDVVYVGNENGSVYGIDASDGTQVWRAELDEPVSSAPTVVDETLYITTTNGLHAVDTTVSDELDSAEETPENGNGDGEHNQSSGEQTADEEPDETTSNDGADDSGHGFGVPTVAAAGSVSTYLWARRREKQE